MKRSILLISLFLIVLVLGCASVKVDYTYDPEADFAALKSYNWLPVPSKNLRYPMIMKQIKHEMNRQLKVRNFKMDSGEPDFFIAFHGGIQAVLAYDDWIFLRENYAEYALKRRIDMIQYTEDTLIVDFIDAESRELIYRASASIRLSLESTAEKREKKIIEAVTKILDNYLLIGTG